MSILTEWYERLIDFANQKPTIVFWFFICSAILLFTPDYYLRIIRIEFLAKKIAPFSGLIFILSGFLSFINIISLGKQYFHNHREKQRELNQKRNLLEQLEQLFNQNEVKSGFRSQQDCIAWSNRVAPLLKFNDQYYMNFMGSSHNLNNMNIYGDLAASLFNTMISQVEMAISELRQAVGRMDSK